MVSVRHDFHTRDFRKGQAYLDTQNLMQGGKAAEYSGFYTHSSSGSDVIWLVSQLIYHILSLDLIFSLWPRWSILIFGNSFVHFKAFKEGTDSKRTLLPLSCKWFLLLH